MSFPRLTLKLRVVVSVVLVLAVSMGALVSVVAARNGATARADAFRYAEQLSTESAAQASAGITSAMETASGLAETLAALSVTGGTRAQADAVQRRLLEASPAFLGVWTGWEPNAFDGRDADFVGTPAHDATGRYVPYWFRDGSAIAVDALVDYDQAGAGDYYLLARTTGRPKVLEPYQYEVAGTEMLITSVAVPITVDGAVVGVAGVDLSLSQLQEQVAEIQPYGTGRATLVSTAGAVVGSGADAEPGKALAGPAGELAADVTRTGRVAQRVQQVGDDEVLQVAAPLPLATADTWALVVTIPTDSILEQAHALRRLSVELAIGALLVAALASFAVARSVVRPIEALRDRMAEIADGDGDLTQRIDESRSDEAGELGAAFNRFVAKVADTIRAISDSAATLTGAADDLTAVAVTLQRGADGTSDQATSASSAAEQVNAGVQSLATGTGQMSASISEITSSAARAAGVAQEAVDVAEATTQKISELGEASSAIGNVVVLITSIAQQTNLLALNATIEAARAGESGKGFAVVAGEVKELAQQTAHATEEITHQISTIQASTSGAAEAIGHIQQVIGQIRDFSTTIAGAVEEQSATTAEMTRGSSAAAAGSGEIVRAVSDVARLATTTAEGARSAQDAATRLSGLADDLRTLVGAFRT